jgi:hypothetical protein
VLAGDAALDHAAEAFAGVLVDDRDDLDRSAVGAGVELEVGCPAVDGRATFPRKEVRIEQGTIHQSHPCGNHVMTRNP